MEFIIWLKDIGFDAWLTSIVANNIITIQVAVGGIYGVLKVITKLTPSKKDDAAIAQLERVSDDIFRIMQPQKKN